MDYTEISCILPGMQDREILAYKLSEIGFESFLEEGNELRAYIPCELFDPVMTESVISEFKVAFHVGEIREQNWNAAWERQYEPVLIRDLCYIRAPFHGSLPGIKYEIIIEPKMSFGTAHHETTFMMIDRMLEMTFAGKNALDIGCGTGVLAILASKMGSREVVAVDLDEWAYRNALENISRNNTGSIDVILGDISVVGSRSFEIILANINRNVIVEQLPRYYGLLTPGGNLLMSGFYEDDLPLIRGHAENLGLHYDSHIEKNKWIAVILHK